MRKLTPANVLGLTFLAVLVLITWTWRPWDDDAQARITSSGLLPVLTLLLGQVGSWAISSASSGQALAVRQLELDHEVDRDRVKVERETHAASAEAEVQKREQVRTMFLEAIRSTSELGPSIANVIQREGGVRIPAGEFTRARVALLAVASHIEAETEVGVTRASVMDQMDALYRVRGETRFNDISGLLLTAITQFESAVAGADLLR